MSIQNKIVEVLKSNNTGIGATDKLAENWYYIDEINISTEYGTYEVSEVIQKAKFLHLLSNECGKTSPEKAKELLTSLSEGYLGAFHKKAMLKGENPIASDDTMSAEEYKERNIALIDKELDKVRNSINALCESGYINKTEAEKAKKKTLINIESIFTDRFGEVYDAKVEKEQEFKELKDIFESVGLYKLSFKKSESSLTVAGECSLLDLQAINAQATLSQFILKSHKMDIAAGTVACTFEKELG